MGMNAALVDRARIVRQVRTNEKVDGRPRRKPFYGPWFKCRLLRPSNTEQKEEGRTAYKKAPNFMAARRATDRSEVRILGSDQLEIESEVFGNALYSVEGDPRPIRKRRTFHHWEGQVTRIDEKRGAGDKDEGKNKTMLKVSGDGVVEV